MLVHNVAALLKSPPGTTREVTIFEPSPGFGDDITVRSPVQGTARLQRTQRGILVQCEITTTVELECSRCLEPFEHPISVQFVEEFLPTIDIASGAPLETTDDDALRIDEHHILDLTEVVRQYILTGIPLKPVCNPDCPGLCPICGREKARGSCRCEAEAEPPGPFAALRTLLPPSWPPHADSR